VPHVLFTWCCGPCAFWFTRYNLRKKNGVAGNLLGDFMCITFCGLCSFLQHLRASAISDWALVPITAVPVAEMKVIV
jgi:Cys-rich protein (TIGR01571 family)